MSNLEARLNFYRHFVQFSSKQRYFLPVLPAMLHGWELRWLQKLTLLSATCEVESANDHQEKTFNLFFFLLFILKYPKNEPKKFWICFLSSPLILEISWNFQQTAIFHLWPKSSFFTEPIKPCNIFTNWLWKTKKSFLNSPISTTRKIFELRKEIGESTFILIWKSNILHTFYAHGYTSRTPSSKSPDFAGSGLCGSKG